MIFVENEQIYVVGKGHYHVRDSDIMFTSINGEPKPVVGFPEPLDAEEAYARALEEAYSAANVIAIIMLEAQGANS